MKEKTLSIVATEVSGRNMSYSHNALPPSKVVKVSATGQVVFYEEDDDVTATTPVGMLTMAHPDEGIVIEVNHLGKLQKLVMPYRQVWNAAVTALELQQLIMPKE